MSASLRRLLPLLVLLVVGCPGRTVPAVGPLREVTVATDDWGGVEDAVRGILQQRIATPQPEPEFRLRVFTLDQFKTYSLFRTLLMVGTTDDSVIRGVLKERVDSLPGGNYGLFRIPNPWADNQVLLVFAAREPGALVPGLEEYADRIREAFRSAVLDHCRRAVYHRGHNRAAEDSLRDRFAFGVDVPKSWWLRQDFADERFVYLYGHHPDRNVFVYWEEGGRELEPAEMWRLRDSLTGLFYDGDSVPDTLRSADTVEFLGGPCLRQTGIWQNEKDVLGGPVVNYAFNHEGRFFMLDGLVYNPGRPKLDGLYQVEAVMRTFTPR